MENDSLCSPTTRNEQPEEKEGEENKDGSCANAETSNTSERCPICLNYLTREVGFPEECCHAFCVSCILKWSETSSSCPVDRKPFQAIYKTDPVGSLTKISVKERRPRENLSCDQTLKYCTKGKLCFRVYVKDDAGEVVTPKLEQECLDNKAKPEMEIMRMSCSNCITGDIIATCPFTFSEATPCFNNRTEQEESEVCLIRRKREALKHLRIPFGADGMQSNSTLPAEILIHPPSPLDEYIFPLSPIPFKSQGSSTRVCAHTGGCDGNEKKQAASGTSTSRGTRKKSVQTSTRRRSTRNSKSDTSNLQSSPKSSSSDHDTPGHNATNTTNTSPSEHSGKQSSKQQKQAPKKGSRTRKRICSATQYQAESKDNDSESEAEQEKKCKLSDDNLSETELSKLNSSPNNSIAKDDEHTDMSSPLKHSEEKLMLDSSPAHAVQSIDKEQATSPDFHNKHEFNEEHPSSPVFRNGQTDLEDSHVDFQRSAKEISGVNSTEDQLDIEAEPSLLSENLKVSDEDRSNSSPQSEKHIISDHTELPPLTCDKVEPCNIEESASLPSSPTEIKSPVKYIPESPTSDEIDISAENHLHPSQQLQSNESHFQSVESSSTESMLPPELVKRYDLDNATTSPVNKEQSIQKPEGIQNFRPDESLKSVHKQEELEKVLEVSLQAENQEECTGTQDAKTSMTSELNNQHRSESSTLLTEQSEQSLELSKKSADELSSNIDICGNILCKEELHSPTLGDGQINDTDRKTNLKNDQQKTSCDDKTEPVAMECDSLCSNLNDSEVEQSVKIIEPTETDNLAEKKASPSKQPLPTEDASKKESRTRKSRFHSPSTTWSPSKNDVKERQRSLSPSKTKDSPLKRKSSSPSRDKDGERGHGAQWKGRSRDRHHKRHSRSRSRHSQSRNRHSRSRSKHSRSKSRSRSRSGSCTRYKNRIVTVDRNEKDCGSPPWKERRSNENWRSPWGSEKYRRNEPDKHEHFRIDKYEARDYADAYPDNKNDYPDWVVERIKSVDSRGRGDTWMRGEGRGRWERGWGDPRGRGDRGRGRGDFRGRGENRSRGDRGRGGNRGRGYHWDDGQYGSGDSWNRNVNMDWNSPRSRGGRGRGGFRGGFNYGEQHENNWNNRQPYSGNSATQGPECSRILESKNKPKYEDMFDSAVDRSGWSSASSWAVRKTLPADVQNYYSKRGKSTTGSQGGVWPKQEETQDQDQAATDQASQQNESTPVSVNMVQTQMNIVQQPVAAPPQPMNIAAPPQPMNIAAPPQPMNIAAPPQPMNIPAPPQPMNIAASQPMNMSAPPQPMSIPAPPQPLNMFPYSVGVHPPLVNIQHNPYNLHPQLPPIHLHPALPVVQMSAPSSVPQGLPPPPPPPPPAQQISYIAPPQDAKPLQSKPGASYVSNNVNAPLLPAPSSVQGTIGVALGLHSASVATSGYSKNSYTSSVKYITRNQSVTVEASADSSKKEKKILIQERAAQEVKGAIKQYYQNKDITKDEYKEIVKKAVDKVCHSKSGEVDSAKVANLVKAYVDKYKHSRKKGVDDKL